MAARPLIRQADAARLLGMSRQLLRHHIKAGRLETRRDATTGLRLVTRASVDRLKRERES